MSYKIFFLLIFINLSSCIENPIKPVKTNDFTKKYFVNKGFALIYSPTLTLDKLVNKKINDRELLIFQKNLKKNTTVKIINLLNNRSILARVGANVDYPDFYNSVITYRIAEELSLNFDEPYINVTLISQNSTLVNFFRCCCRVIGKIFDLAVKMSGRRQSS